MRNCLSGLVEAAENGFKMCGRGSLALYAGQDPILYLTPEQVKDDARAVEMIKEYNPHRELIVTFFEEGSVHSYRLKKPA